MNSFDYYQLTTKDCDVIKVATEKYEELKQEYIVTELKYTQYKEKANRLWNEIKIAGCPKEIIEDGKSTGVMAYFSVNAENIKKFEEMKNVENVYEKYFFECITIKHDLFNLKMILKKYGIDRTDYKDLAI